MKNIALLIFVFLFSVPAWAQTAIIPLFDNTQPPPNIGRDAKPLDSLLITPNPLPPVRIDLQEGKAPLSVSQPQPAPAVKPAVVSQPAPALAPRTVPVPLTKAAAPRAVSQILAAPAPAPAPTPAQPAAVKPPVLDNLFVQRHDVKRFDISGFALGMTPEETADTAKETGYKIARIEHGIPLFRALFYEHRCRNAGVYIHADIQKCIIRLSQGDAVYYISGMILKRPESQETVKILFSTHATDNQAYKITYESLGDNSLNFTRRNLAKKLRRKDAFWNLVFETYGLPDDSDKIIWGDENASYMQAFMEGSSYNAYVILENKEIPEQDYISAEDESQYLAYKTPFSFGQAAD